MIITILSVLDTDPTVLMEDIHRTVALLNRNRYRGNLHITDGKIEETQAGKRHSFEFHLSAKNPEQRPCTVKDGKRSAEASFACRLQFLQHMLVLWPSMEVEMANMTFLGSKLPGISTGSKDFCAGLK